MATLSGTLKRFRVFLDMGKPPLEIVAYSSALFFPFRLRQNTNGTSFRVRFVSDSLLMIQANLIRRIKEPMAMASPTTS